MTSTLNSELNLDQLEALARAATPGPWRASQNSVFAGPRYRVVPRVTAGGSSQGMIDDLKWEKANAAHIAAANPAAVLELIALARRAQSPAVPNEPVQALPDERVQFEKWARQEWPDGSLEGCETSGGWYYFDDVCNDFWICWKARAAIASCRALPAKDEARAPWDDYEGNPIYAGDVIEHPHSKERGKVIYTPSEAEATDRWRVYYENRTWSRLCLQVGDKGQAIVVESCRAALAASSKGEGK